MSTALPLFAAYEGATIESLEAEKKVTPYYPTVYDPSTLVTKGHVTVAKGRTTTTMTTTKTKKDGFDMYYEIHGTGVNKLAFIVGLNNSCFTWLPQVEVLCKKPEYSCLVFDNRGAGNSETPGGRYKTSEMALDLIDLLKAIEWTKPRSIHLIGVSMGGMISLEVAKQRPDLLASLHVVSGTPGGRRYSAPKKGVSTLFRVLSGRTFGFDSERYRFNRLLEILFPTSFLNSTCPKDPNGRTYQQVFYDQFQWRFQFTRRQSFHGAISQIFAALGHNISDLDLANINLTIPKILLYTGDTDHLVDPRNSIYMKAKMPKAELIQFNDAGHALGPQFTEQMNQIIQRGVQEALDSLETGEW